MVAGRYIALHGSVHRRGVEVMRSAVGLVRGQGGQGGKWLRADMLPCIHDSVHRRGVEVRSDGGGESD